MIRCQDCGRWSWAFMSSALLNIVICIECWRKRIMHDLDETRRLREAFHGRGEQNR